MSIAVRMQNVPRVGGAASTEDREQVCDDHLAGSLDLVLVRPVRHKRAEVVAEVSARQLQAEVLLGQSRRVAVRPLCRQVPPRKASSRPR